MDKLENVFMKHYAPNHMPDPKVEWTLRENVVVVDLLFYVHSKHLRSCRDGQLT